MGRWVPDFTKPVAGAEAIGRRIFDEPGLIGAVDQPVGKWFLDFRHFEESRDPGEVSLDRLGNSGLNGKVASGFLVAKARDQGKRFSREKQFHGWVYLKASDLAKPKHGPAFPVVASPQHPDDPGNTDHNPYHAHVCRPADYDSYETAIALRELFSKGRKYPVARVDASLIGQLKAGAQRSIWLVATKITSWLS